MTRTGMVTCAAPTRIARRRGSLSTPTRVRKRSRSPPFVLIFSLLLLAYCLNSSVLSLFSLYSAVVALL